MASHPDRPPARSLQPLRALLPFLRPYRRIVALAMSSLVVASGAMLVLPLIGRNLIDLGFVARNPEVVDRYFGWFLLAAVVFAVFAGVRLYMVTWLGERVVADIRDAVYRRVVRMDPTFFEVTRTGEVLSRLTTDTTLVQSIAGVGLSMTVRGMLNLAGALVMLAFTSPKLMGVILVLIPAVIAPLILVGRRVRKLSRAAQDRIADSSGLAGETLNAIQTVQAFTLETLLSKRFHDSVEASFDVARQRTLVRSVLTAVGTILVFVAVLFVLWLGTRAVQAGELSVGQLGQFLWYAMIIATSAPMLTEMWGEVQRAAGAMERLAELLQVEPRIQAPAQPQSLPATLSVKSRLASVRHREPGAADFAQAVPSAPRPSTPPPIFQPGKLPPARLRFENVSFSYPSRSDSRALHDLTLDIAAGETVAFVGPSGAGKSTTFQLLLRFYDPQQGRILLDGVDIATLDPRELRGCIGLVPQETMLFGATARENIRYGREGATEEQIEGAARAAAADTFLRALPEGYDTFLGERGARLSGGQRQRMAIARAILKDPPILLLDEATSALDAESERLVQTALEELMQYRTTIVIAHRLATVLKADRIVLFDQGRVVAAGTHAELVKTEPLYARLAQLQFGEQDS